jgi:hypothetical protein
MKDQSVPLRKEMAKLLAPPRLFLLVIIQYESSAADRRSVCGWPIVGSSVPTTTEGAPSFAVSKGSGTKHGTLTAFVLFYFAGDWKLIFTRPASP